LRDELLQGTRDADAAIELLAALPPVDLSESETGLAAMRPADGHYGYALGGHVVARGAETEQVVDVAACPAALAERAVPHSHAKVSGIGGMPVMVGALARVTLHGGLLTARARVAVDRLGLHTPSRNPLDNNLAQAVELVLDIERSLAEVESFLETGLRAESLPPVRPRAATGTAVSEAPRGLLIHRYTYSEHGCIVGVDIVTPTAINAASIERRAAATAEAGAALPDAELRQRLEMLVRAYDPCISCSVHVLRTPP